MYLPLLSTSIGAPPARGGGGKRSLHSTTVPLARRYNGSQPEVKTVRKPNVFAAFEWVPIKFDDMVVYVRRALPA